MSSPTYDLLLRGGRLVDPLNKRDELADLGIAEGKVMEIGQELSVAQAARIVDVEGLVVIPGLIDIHVHLAYWFGCQAGYRMLARAGVTTAVDAAGPPNEIIRGIKERGVGINIATLNTAWPTRVIPNDNPSDSEIDHFIDISLQGGAVGLKILGGHFPLTPDATARLIERAALRQVMLVFHVGTTRTPGNLEGMFEAVELADGHPLHIAHINAYCRGQLSGDALEDARQALRLLERSNNVTSDSYLFSRNGTPALCIEGVPVSHITQGWLAQGGYESTESGLGQAIIDGYAWVVVERDGENVYVQGEEAHRAWRDAGTDTAVSFKSNPYVSMIPLAIEKDANGNFIVDTLATDGGGIPRNVLIEKGIALIRLGALTLDEFIQKSSVTPAKLFGLRNKGHLDIGADADIAVVDMVQGVATHTIVKGQVVLQEGEILGEGGTLLVTAAGVVEANAHHVQYEVIG